jgi:hypothetical protein
MLLSTLIIILVTSVFLVQNEFYSDVVRRSALQENVRTATAMVSSELRGVAAGGIVAAESDSVVFRIPLVVGGVCAVSGSETYLHLPLEGENVDAAEVAGYGTRDADGVWTHTAATWESVFHSSGGAAAVACQVMGADTVGGRDDFYRLDGLASTPPLAVGDLVMIYRELEFKLETSALDPTSTAVFRGQAGGTLSEFANHLRPSSAFEYKLSNNPNYRSRVTGGNLDRIVAIRFSARGAVASSRANRDSLTFDLTASVPLGNAY